MASATPEISRRRVVWSLNIVSFSWSIGLGAAVPVIPILAFQLQDNVALAGVVVTMGGAGRLIVSYATGPLVDRFGRRGIAIVGVTIRMIFSFLEGLSPTYLSLVFFRFMSGVGTATWGTGLQTITADISKRSDRGSITGSRQGFQHLGMIIGPFVGTAAWAATGDIRVPFFINGFSKMICLLVFLFVMVETRSLSQEEDESEAPSPKPAEEAPASGKTPTPTPAAVATPGRRWDWPAFIASGFMFVAIGLFATGLFRAAVADTMLSLYVRNILELPQSTLGLAISGIGFGGLVASVAGGRIADRMGVGIIVVPGALIIAGALLLVTFDPGTLALSLMVATAPSIARGTGWLLGGVPQVWGNAISGHRDAYERDEREEYGESDERRAEPGKVRDAADRCGSDERGGVHGSLDLPEEAPA